MVSNVTHHSLLYTLIVPQYIDNSYYLRCRKYSYAIITFTLILIRFVFFFCIEGAILFGSDAN